MSTIRVLPEEIANRIAAGEVIERPASVVKELIENSIDAGASRITVETQHGGRRLIQVSDDGCGMDRDDAMLCLEAHATSKIREAYDIDRIITLGFRGEALPSIAAVSKFTLQTRQADDLAGVEVVVDGGTIRDVRDCGCAPGTNVVVRNLFFNLPVRRKFLRQPATEDQHVQETVLLQALAHPGIAFELTMNGQRSLQVGTNVDPGARIGMLLGKDVYRAMVPVEYSEDGIEVTGFVARPGMTRTNRREQRAFVNGRPAAADPIYFGIRDAYHTLVMKGRYPPVVLYLEMPPEMVDVNVHPTKREVRFRDGRLIGQIVAAAIRHALRALADDIAPRVQPSLAGAARVATMPPPEQQYFTRWEHAPAGASAAPPSPAPASGPMAAPGSPDSEPPPAVTPEVGLPEAPPTTPPPEETGQPMRGPSPSAATRDEIRQLRVIGVLDTLYLVAEGANGLVLVDQHAAHERILFEKILAAARAQDGATQPLLLPVTVELSPADAALLRKSIEHFTQLGFQLDPFGGDTFLITGVPAHFPQENIAGMLRDILDDLRDSVDSMRRPDEVRIAQAACKHAVKSEDPLAGPEIERLLEDLAQAEMPYTCPHGRPVMINIPNSEIQKRFGRRQ
jgi:DNA mismatch repair protein MutL